MTVRRRILQAVTALSTVALLVALIHFLPLSTSMKYQRVLVDLGHVPLFAVIAFGVLYLAELFAQERMGLRGYGFAGLVILLIGIGSEAVQSLDPDRSASFGDLLRNCAGGALGTMFHAVAASKFAVSSRRQKTLIRLGVLLVVLVLMPAAWTAAAYIHRFHSWPTVIGENYRLERVFTGAFESELEQVPVPSEWQANRDESALMLRLRDCLRCGILLQELGHEWGGLSRLCFDLTNPGTDSLQLSVRLGTAPMFFRSVSSFGTGVIIPATTRTNECLELARFAGSATTGEASEPFRSAALLSDADTRVTADILVHRIWLE